MIKYFIIKLFNRKVTTMKLSVYNDLKTSLFTDLRDYFLLNI